MKIKVSTPTESGEGGNTLLEADVSGEVMLEGVYNGVGILNESAVFGIAERDTGLEIQADGRLFGIQYEPDSGRWRLEVNGELVWRSGDPS